MAAAAAAIPREASPTFLTTGRTDLAAFAGRGDIRFLARVIEPISPERQGEAWPPRLDFVYARGPFAYEDERRLLETRGVKCIVTKNSGGAAARAKLDAARDLGLPVIMVRRPVRPAGRHVVTAEQAQAWLERALHPESGDVSGLPAA